MNVTQHPIDLKLESWLVTAGRSSEPGAALNVPLVPASNFIIGGRREYSRDDGTPTWEALEEVVGGLESGRAVAFASGFGFRPTAERRPMRVVSEDDGEEELAMTLPLSGDRGAKDPYAG